MAAFVSDLEWFTTEVTRIASNDPECTCLS
jgi:hypothetical protein